MKKVSIAALKRMFESNTGREVIAEFPSMTVVGNCGNTVYPVKTQKRTIKSVKGNKIWFEKEDGGLTSLQFEAGMYAFMDPGVVEMFLENGSMFVKYIF